MNPFEKGKPFYQLLRMAHGAEVVTLVNLPPKDCARCFYRDERMRDGGHCYMFREEPIGAICVMMSDAIPALRLQPIW